MPNMTPKKHEMPTQDPKVRATNFFEVATGYTEEMAISEAERCLHCPTRPCVNGCPVHINIPEFIARVKEKDFEGAYKIIAESSSLPAVCGRVCPQESQCECYCVRGKNPVVKSDPVGIGRLERFVADYHNQNNKEIPAKPQQNGHKVAIIGSGPSGLTCAGDLAKQGFKVTIFEALHVAGGVLVYGIPEFRLPKAIVQKEVDNLKALGVDIQTNVVIGKTLTIDELFEEGYEAIYIGSGAGLPKFMNIPGEGLKGVLSANEFLTRINLMKAYQKGAKTPIKIGKKAYVIGGGNVAMDAVRCLKRLGIETHLMYRRSEEELPARKMEVEHAKEEGIAFDLLQNPTKILTNENNDVVGMEVVNMVLGEPGPDGRRGVTEDKESLHTVECDMVVMALGTSPNHEALKESNIELTEKGLIKTEEDKTKTSKDKVFAGGDAVTGAATVILAMEAGKKAAKEIMEKLS